MAMAPAELRPMPQRGPSSGRLKEALGAALLALGLSVPILALRTEQNKSNSLMLQPRWGYVAIAVLAGLRRRGSLYLAGAAACAPRATRSVRRLRASSAGERMPCRRWADACCCSTPALRSRSPAGPAPIKWIDNFGIQILIYIMLGWGLNIVVGLAGLLDLGYVAFYAVGAYAYALLAQRPSHG